MATRYGLIQYKILTEPVYVPAGVAEDITVDKWYQPLSLPVRARKSTLKQEYVEPFYVPGITTPTVTLDDIFCNRNLVTLADFQDFISDFDAVAVNSHRLSVADFEFLDYDEDKTLVFDRDIWLHRLLVQNVDQVDNRLAFPDNSDSDPLGLQTGRDNVIIIDQENPNSVKIRTSNTVTAQDGGTPLIPSSGTTGLLWNSINDTSYNYVLWYQFSELDETGSAATRRFPGDGRPITVYIRGGEQFLDDSFNSFVKGTSTFPDTSKIIIRAYPGETVITHFAVTHASNYAIGFTRPFCSLRDLVLYGWSEVGSGNDKTYAPKFVSLGGAGCSIIDCELRECAGIDPSGPDAATHPELVDQGWSTRGASPSATGRLVQIFSDNFLLKGSYFEYAPITFPWDGVSWSGDALDIREQSRDGIVRYCELEGFVPHSQIRLQGTYTTIEYNHLGSGGDINIIVYGDSSTLGGHHNTIRYNRLHAWNTVNPVASAGNNIQTQGMQYSEIYGNVIWGTESIDGRGIILGNNPTGLDLDCHDNLVYNNLIYHAGIMIGYQSGRPTSGTNKIYDNSVFANVLVDFSADDKLSPKTDAPMYVNLDDPLANNGYNNIIYDNIIIRDDSVTGQDIVVRLPGDLYNYYLATDTVGTWIQNNLDDDPLWTDAANGDFTLLSGSPVTWLDGNEPLTEWEDAPEVYTCFIGIDKWGQPTNEPIIEFREQFTDYTQFEPILTPELPSWITYDSWAGSSVVPVLKKRKYTETEFIEPFTAALTAEIITIDKWFNLTSLPLVLERSRQSDSNFEPLAIPNYYQPVAEILTDFAIIPVQPRQRSDFLEPAYWYGVLTDIPENPVEPVEPEIVTPQYPTIYSAVFNTFDIDI